MNRKQMGVLVMAYGTPYKEADIERYYTDIRHGQKPTKEMLEDLKSRYQAIGGISPLARITQEQANALETNLNNKQEEYEFHVYIGLKHIEPFIEDAVAQMAEDGIEDAVSLVLAPHFSTYSVKAYNKRANDAAKKHGKPAITMVNSWYNESGFIDFWAKQINAVYENMPESEKEKAALVVSAHSLPEKILKNGDPYPDQLKETAALISEKTGIKNYAVGWQSEGNTPDPWIGPDVQDLTRDLYKEAAYRSFVYAPVGFIADHLEVLYDNDYECKVVCDELGATYHRPEMPNAHPEFIDALAGVVMKKVKTEA